MKTLLRIAFVLMILTPVLGNAQVKLYPNPIEANDFYITSTERLTKVQVYNILGEKIFETACFDFHKNFEIPDISSGIYLVKIFTQNSKNITIKMIKT